MKNNGEESLVSILMPTYNSEKYVEDAIQSVLSQDYQNWELIVSDDGSSDRTSEIVKRIQDNRIKYISDGFNSGSAFGPRKNATSVANGKWILILDSDDYISTEYISKMVFRAEKVTADLCLGQMVLIEENVGERIIGSIPEEGFNYDSVISGDDAIRLICPTYKISLNGMLIRFDIWKNGIIEYDTLFNKKDSNHGVHDDEIAAKLMVMKCHVVAFEKDCLYYYRVNNQSVTHCFNWKAFDYMKAISEERLVYRSKYGAYSEFDTIVNIEDFNAFIYTAKMFWASSGDLSCMDATNYIRYFKKWYSRLNKSDIFGHAKQIRRWLIFDYTLIFASCAKPGEALTLICKMLGSKVKNKLYQNKYYSWYILNKGYQVEKRKRLLKRYNERENERAIEGIVVNVFDGTMQMGGLADRLRGIISTYSICKKKGLDYRLFFESPFPLEDYLEPNIYNWKIDENEIAYNKKQSKVVILDTTQNNEYQKKKQKRFLDKSIKNDVYQKHVYTTAAFAYDENYQELFWELFKPSKRLQAAIDKELSVLKDGYISVSCRFLDLLGDFNETQGYGIVLGEDEQKKLIGKLKYQIEELHDKYPKSVILVNSDSVKFIKEMRSLEYVYSIEGNVTHIDAENDEYNYDKYEKTFLDFMVIAKAAHIYLLRSGDMLRSGYPYAASKLYDSPFSIIELK